jgi:hypothetical protein
MILLAVLAAGLPSTATAAPVLELNAGGHVRARNDPFLPATLPPAQPTVAPRGAAAYAPRGRVPTVTGTLGQLRAARAITASAFRGYMASVRAAVSETRRLRGTRKAELQAVIKNLQQIAAARGLTSARLPALFLTLDRNRQWWTAGTVPAQWQRVEFAGSQLVWEYYPGQGIELQVLGSFAKADGMYTAGPSQYAALQALLGELIPLAVQRGGGLTWEYYLHFDGGSPPWTSAMSQGTAIEALTRASEATRQSAYLALAHRALGIFQARPPAGVAEPTAHGTRYLQYSFASRTYILNAFLQSLIGLYDYAQVSGDALAQRLFAAGDSEARAEVPSYDTGAWSLYQPGVEDSLDYHTLVTGFLQQLCTRTAASVYCDTAQRFQSYLKIPPALKLLTQTARRRKPLTIAFSVSKYSHVGIVVVRGSKTVFGTSADFPYGVGRFRVTALTRGTYTVRLAATDLAGNFSRIVGTLRVK